MISIQKIKNIGEIYRLIEQFELISRTDLAKLSGLAPASITNITKALIESQFILERTVQNSVSRGRPAVGLAVSPFFWQQLCLTLSPHNVNISLCELNGSPIYSRDYTVYLADYPSLDDKIIANLQHFFENHPLVHSQILALSISVIGKINPEKTTVIQLGSTPINCQLVDKLSQQFSQPILLNDHFSLWLLAEASVGSLMGDDSVIFLQLDDNINLSVLMRGALLHQQKMNVDKMLMPKFSALSDQIYPKLDDITRQQLKNQITSQALVHLIDLHLPNTFTATEEKMTYFCQLIKEDNRDALAILNHISDNLAYVLMNLINIFSTTKILLETPLHPIKSILFAQIQQKLKKSLLLNEQNVQLVSSQFEWNHLIIPTSAIKQGIYNGNLIENIIQTPFF